MNKDKQDKIKCVGCGISIPDVPEDATLEERLCDRCLNQYEESIGTPNDRRL